MKELIERIQHELDQRELVAESMLGTGYEQSRSDIAIGKILEDCKAALSQQEAVGYTNKRSLEFKIGDSPTFGQIWKEQSLLADITLYTAPPSTAQDGMVKDAARWNFLKGKFGFNQHGIYLPCGRVTEQDRAQMAVDTDIAVDKAMLKAASKGE